jgi:hypothetical protein
MNTDLHFVYGLFLEDPSSVNSYAVLIQFIIESDAGCIKYLVYGFDLVLLTAAASVSGS